MVRHVFMLILALVAAGAMTFILFRFFRKLRQIEIEFWGAQAREVNELAEFRRSRQASKRARAAKGEQEPAGHE